MSGSNDQTPPITRAPAPAPAGPAPSGGVSRSALIWIGVAVVVLSFVAAFLGSYLARASADPAPAPTVTVVAEPEASATVPPDYEDIIEGILPAGSAVRAGTGAPESGKGYEGDIYIDRATADVWLFQDDWVRVGNIKTSAAENLTGATGATGAQGDAGAAGEPGAPGTAGTQVALGAEAPDDATCTTNGDIFLNITPTPPAYYTCTDGAWVLVEPAATP
ncbi:MAG: hypothetical protein ABWY55_08795 [Microbacterium sp.]